MHPRRAVAQALLAALRGAGLDGDVCDLAQVLAGGFDGLHGQHLTVCQAFGLVVDPVEHRLLEVERAEHDAQHLVVGAALVTQAQHLGALGLQHREPAAAVAVARGLVDPGAPRAEPLPHLVDPVLGP